MTQYRMTRDLYGRLSWLYMSVLRPHQILILLIERLSLIEFDVNFRCAQLR